MIDLADVIIIIIIILAVSLKQDSLPVLVLNLQ